MIDADELYKLAEIERKATGRGGHAPYMLIECETVRELVASARQAIAYRALIDAHNAGIEAECGIVDVPGERYRACTGGKVLHYGEKCSNCPRRHLIDVAAADAQPKEPGAC